MKRTSPKLPLTVGERTCLRTRKVKLAQIGKMELSELTDTLQCTQDRAKYLRALAQFQSIPSIGPRIAQVTVDLGYYTLSELENADGAELIDRYEAQTGYWNDPCLEDSFRCIVHHAKHLNSDKSWFDFTAERKAYRKKFGYPATRPSVAWHVKKHND